MTKLFAMESDDSGSDELLIDKVIQKADKDKEGLRVTADLMKQRQVLKTEITKELKEVDKTDKEEQESEEAVEYDEESKEGTDTKEDVKEEESSDDKSEESDKEEPKDAKEDEEEEDDSTESAQDEGDLEALMGSALESKEPKGAKEKEVKAQESFPITSILSANLFYSIKAKHAKYRIAVEAYNLSIEGQTPQSQPVAYVKEEVLTSLKTMTSLANQYAAKNLKQVETGRKALLSLSESLVVYEQCHSSKKLHLTLKTVTDESKLKFLCAGNESDLKETSAVLLKYITDTTNLVVMVLQNYISSIKTSLSICGYQGEEDVYTYKKPLAGFNEPRVNCLEYQDYLSTKYSDYQAYRVQTYKVQELYDLKGISITKDDELTTVQQRLYDVVIQSGLALDNLKDITDKYIELTEKVKALCFDVQEGKVKSLADLPIDDSLKDFIRFKLSSELYTTSVNVSIEYVTTVLDAFSTLIELDN